MRKEPDVPFVNSSGERIPPGALMVPGAVVDDDGAVSVSKPTAASMPGLLVNGEFSVEPDAKGGGTFGPLVAIAYAEDEAPAAGSTLGSAAGSWLATAGNFGWVAYGTDAADWGLVNAVRDGTGSPENGGGANRCGWLAELVNWSGLFLSILSRGGMCGCIDPDQKLLLVRGDGPGEWVPVPEYGEGEGLFASCLEFLSVKFVSLGCEQPCLELTTTTGGTAGETTYRLFFDYCDAAEKFVVFAGSGPTFCDGDPTPCKGDDSFRVKIACATVCVNECDGETVDVPAVLHGTFVGGDCTILAAPFVFTYTGAGNWVVLPNANRGAYQGCSPDGLSNNSSGVAGACLPGGVFQVNLVRNSAVMPLMSCDHWSFTGTVTAFTCNPFSITFNVTAGHAGPNPGTNPCATTPPTSFVLTA